jgi:glycosidase
MAQEAGREAAKEAPPIKHTFVFQADRQWKSVAVAGTFNGWNKNANSLNRDADGHTWRVTLPLNYGKYFYKFVLDDEQWIVDPKAARQENDGSGNLNSVLLIAPPDYKTPANPNDGKTAVSAFKHQHLVPYLNYDRGKLIISLRTRPHDLRQIYLITAARRYLMRLIKSDDLYAFYQCEIAWDRKQNLSYNFELWDGKKKLLFGANGLAAPYRSFQIIAKNFVPFQVPDWVERTVFYQIFPDRFENGDKANDPPDVVAWNTKPQWFNRFGGDVAGVRKRLPYLKELGISSVYFNPVFQSPSNHRYDAEDFKKIDPQFGTNAEFVALTRELQASGIRTVMDFVFNHTATTFPAFVDVRQKGEASAYKNWYFIKSYPVRVQNNPNYVAWNNYQSMPKLNLLNPATSEAMLQLVDFWKEQVPLAGLRLDVANEVDMRFWRKLRGRAKNLDSQMWIVGEVWGDGAPWLGGDQWDSVMNYQFRDACIGFFAEDKTSPSQFARRLMEIHQSYLPQVSRNMMNLLSSHDTPRFLTLCKDDVKLHQLAATVQFTWIGAPSIYYGEELGMPGGADPDNRRGMQWEKATPDNEMLRHYKKLIQIRNSNRALQSGEPSILLANDKAKTIAYARILDGNIAIVALNRSSQPQTLEIRLPDSANTKKAKTKVFIDALNQKRALSVNGKLKIQLAPLSAAVLLAK